MVYIQKQHLIYFLLPKKDIIKSSSSQTSVDSDKMYTMYFNEDSLISNQ